MEYQEFLDEVGRLDFVKSPDDADAMIKAVLGIMCSRMSLEDAQKFTADLPAPLTMYRLRTRQPTPLVIGVQEYIREVQMQFRISGEQAGILVDTVMTLARRAIGRETWLDVEHNMPIEWRIIMQRSAA